jgi:tRNA pseudouridine synthase 10
MEKESWRTVALAEALERTDLRARLARALDAGPLCDRCLGRLCAQVDTGMGNDERGAAIRRTLQAAPPAGPCGICGGLFDEIDVWVERARQALEPVEFDTFLVTSHEHGAMAERERAIQALVGADLAEPYRQEFNRLVGTRLCDARGAQPDFVHPDVVVLADHAEGTVTLDVRPLFVSGRYRKLVRGLPQCRWAAWPSSVQAVIGERVREAAGGEDHSFHGCGREDADVRCLGERPFVLEVLRPRRRRLDWTALARAIARSGAVQVVGLGRCAAEEVARVKSLRPEKTYRALVRLAEPVADLAPLGNLAGRIRQRTPARALRSRSDRVRHRRVRSVAWKSVDARTVEIEVRTQAGLYVKELVSGDGGRTRPSVAEVLGVAAECVELDVTAIHL